MNTIIACVLDKVFITTKTVDLGVLSKGKVYVRSWRNTLVKERGLL